MRQDPPADGPTNMEQDLGLLEHVEQGWIAGRVYSWQGPWVSLGRFQKSEEVLASSIPYVVRPTGGKAVLHGHDVTVGLAMPLAAIGCSTRDVKKAYRSICRPLIDALNRCGMTAALAEETRHMHRGDRTPDCFAFNSANDIVDIHTGKKVCGCAMQITQSAVLIQASIPVGKPLIEPSLAIRGAGDYVGESWDLSGLAERLDEALRYNFANVSA